MFNDTKEKREINRYFKIFVTTHISDSYFDEPESTIMGNIKQLDEIPFDSDWNYLMTLVQLIEDLYAHRGFVSDRNYFRFELGNEEFIQDKGPTKIDAIYSCCLNTLINYWKAENAPPFYLGCEPFDKDDL